MNEWCMWSEIVISNIPEELYCITVVEWEDFLRTSQQGMFAVDDCRFWETNSKSLVVLPVA